MNYPIQPATHSTHPVPQQINQRFLDALTEPLILQAAIDLLEFGFRPVPDGHHRWFALGYSNGIELAGANPAAAQQLLAKVRASAPAHIVRDILSRRSQITKESTLLPLQNAARQITEHPPLLLRSELMGLHPEETVARWFEWTLAAGILAWNHGDLFAGHLRGVIEHLGAPQRFLASRLVAREAEPAGQPRLPAMVSYISSRYPDTPKEREVLTRHALGLYNQLGNCRWKLRRWILDGFRRGWELACTDANTRKAMFKEYGAERMRTVFDLLRDYLGKNRKGWTDQRIYEGSLKYWRAVYPHLDNARYKPRRMELIRILFDFAFWIGVVAVVQIERNTKSARSRQ